MKMLLSTKNTELWINKLILISDCLAPETGQEQVRWRPVITKMTKKQKNNADSEKELITTS
jgi:hypothetical protein